MLSWLQDGVEGAKMSPSWPKLAPRLAQEGSRNYLAGFCRCVSRLFGPILGPSWAVLGPPWPFLGGPRGPLEADLGLRRAAVDMICGKKVGLQKPQKTKGKSMILVDFRGQETTRKLAKWLFGGLLVVLKISSCQVGC